MGKIGIITLNGYFNYGNRLQNYAVQEVICSFGYDPETLNIEVNKPQIKKKKITISERISIQSKKSAVDVIETIKNKIRTRINGRRINNDKEVRAKIFQDFTKKYINETSYKIKEDELKNYVDQYEFFITGSDQVWNPRYISGSSIYFLTFAPVSKRIAFSPSFGVSTIPEKYRNHYSMWLNDMKHLSVREQTGAQIIQKLTGKKAKVLVDPTMLLGKNHWLKIAEKAIISIERKYLLTYFLGGVPNKYKSKIRKIAKDNNLEIINLGDINHSKYYKTGPKEFISYINQAELFCTDSFHGVVFSLIMETPFIAFKRVSNNQSMFSRIENVLRIFSIQNRIFENTMDYDQVFDIDFAHVSRIIDEEKHIAFQFLKKALDMQNE